jgi:mono/diheme cytochrome c family protein
MLRHDPALRGEELFATRCAVCHVLGELGDAGKATAPALDGWGTEAWILGTLHAPDAPHRFGRTPYAGAMPSVDVKPKESPEAWTPMPREDMLAVASFLAAQGDERGEEVPALSPRRDPMLRQAGEAIFKKGCITCHTFEGKGDSAKTGNAPEMSRYGSQAWTRAHVANPSSNATYRAAATAEAKGQMPRFELELPPDDLDLVARWTRAKARGAPLRPGAP